MLAIPQVHSTAFLGDHDGDGLGDLAVGASGDDDGGSDHGAVWILFLDGPFQASATPRNGTGANVACTQNLTLPVLGTSWDSEVQHGHHPGATLTILYGYVLPATGPVIGAGELLVDLTSPRIFRDIVASSGTMDLHSLFVPPDHSLSGLTATAQSLILGGAGAELCSALELRLGY